MRFHRIIFRQSSAVRKLFTGLAVAAYLATLCGVPLPQVAIKSATPFPCQHHRCGCVSADQCWRSCCCFTPSERLAWAKEHHVTPPAELLLAMQADHEHDGHEHNGHDDACCSAGEHQHNADHEHASCCQKPQRACCASSTKTPAATSSDVHVTWVLGLQALKCQGLSTLWVFSGAALPGAPTIEWDFQWQLQGVVAPLQCDASSIPATPPIPPPQIA